MGPWWPRFICSPALAQESLAQHAEADKLSQQLQDGKATKATCEQVQATYKEAAR